MRITYNKVRFALFIRSYPGQYIAKQLRVKYQINTDTAKEISRLAKVLNLNLDLLRFFVLFDPNSPLFSKLKKRLNERDREEIVTYLEIENEILSLSQEKENKESLVRDDYDNALVEPAIERVAGNKLSKVEDDLEFESKLEDLKKRYTKLYYAVAYRYKLPTIRILPFILRLISP